MKKVFITLGPGKLRNSHLAYLRKSILLGKHSGNISITDVTTIVKLRSIYTGLYVQYRCLAENRKTEIGKEHPFKLQLI